MCAPVVEGLGPIARTVAADLESIQSKEHRLNTSHAVGTRLDCLRALQARQEGLRQRVGECEGRVQVRGGVRGGRLP